MSKKKHSRYEDEDEDSKWREKKKKNYEEDLFDVDFCEDDLDDFDDLDFDDDDDLNKNFWDYN